MNKYAPPIVIIGRILVSIVGIGRSSLVAIRVSLTKKRSVSSFKISLSRPIFCGSETLVVLSYGSERVSVRSR